MRDLGGRLGQRGRRRPAPLILSLLFLCCLLSAAFFLFNAPARVIAPNPPADLPELRSVAASNGSDADLPEYRDVDESLPVPGLDGDDEGDQQPADDGDGTERPVEGEIEVTEAGENGTRNATCATAEQMGVGFTKGSKRASLRVRKLIEEHFQLYGPSRVRALPPDQFCRHGFVTVRTTQAGFGNEMYKILTAGALSIMLNRSLIIGKDRNSFPFKGYLSFSRKSFTLGEVKSLWWKNRCKENYGRPLTLRIDHFLRPPESNVLCSDWTLWKQPVILFDGATDAMAAQFFLKNIHPVMKKRAVNLFGEPESFHSRPNVFGELMRALVSPSKAIEEAVRWVLRSGKEVDVTLHARMMSNRSVRAIQAALRCIRRASSSGRPKSAMPRVVLVSDTPSFVREIIPGVKTFAEIIHFDHKAFQESVPNASFRNQQPLAFRTRDWGPSPRWVAFVDFFLASRARRAVISAAHRRIGTTYAQLMAALAAANQLSEETERSSAFTFLSSIHSNLLERGLGSQAGWGHAWSRFGGALSCHRQRHQCAATPLMPPAWWDGRWQSPIPRDVRRLNLSLSILLSLSLSRFPDREGDGGEREDARIWRIEEGDVEEQQGGAAVSRRKDRSIPQGRQVRGASRRWRPRLPRRCSRVPRRRGARARGERGQGQQEDSDRAAAHPAGRAERRGALEAPRRRHHRQRRRDAEHPQPTPPQENWRRLQVRSRRRELITRA